MIKYSEEFDSNYDDELDVWTESKCDDPVCEYCSIRPERPSMINEKREHIGYIDREEGFYKLYAPPKGSIVTHAFILCKYCDGAIYHCMGPKYDAVCFDCYEKDPELR